MSALISQVNFIGSRVKVDFMATLEERPSTGGDPVVYSVLIPRRWIFHVPEKKVVPNRPGPACLMQPDLRVHQ